MYMCKAIHHSILDLPGTTVPKKVESAFPPQLSVISSSWVGCWLACFHAGLVERTTAVHSQGCVLSCPEDTVLPPFLFSVWLLKPFYPLFHDDNWAWRQELWHRCPIYGCFAHAFFVCCSLYSMCFLITMITCIVWWHCFDLILRHHDFTHYRLMHSHYDDA